MAKYRHVHVDFWQDAKVVEEMTPEDRYFYIYLLTNPNTTQIGIYQITKKQMAFELGYSIETINKLLDRFEKVHEVIRYNPDTREIAIINWGKYNLVKGGKPILDCVRRELSEVKDKSMIAVVAQKIPNENIKSLFLEQINDTFHDTSTIRTTLSGEKEKQKEKEKEKQKEKYVESLEIFEDEKLDEIEQVYQSYQNENPHSMYAKYFGDLNQQIGEEINAWIDDLSEELVMEAMKITLEKRKDWRYTRGILRSWAQQGITSLNDLEKQKEKKSAPRRRSQADVWNAFNDYINSLGDEEDE
jgi:DnaD/phage-associated family protein